MAVLTWQRYSRETGGERLAQGLQVLVEQPVAPPLLHHVSFQPLDCPAHAFHMLLQRRVTLLIFHVGLTQLPHLSFTCCWETHKHTTRNRNNAKSEAKSRQILQGDRAAGTIINFLCAEWGVFFLSLGRLWVWWIYSGMIEQYETKFSWDSRAMCLEMFRQLEV